MNIVSWNTRLPRNTFGEYLIWTHLCLPIIDVRWRFQHSLFYRSCGDVPVSRSLLLSFTLTTIFVDNLFGLPGGWVIVTSKTAQQYPGAPLSITFPTHSLRVRSVDNVAFAYRLQAKRHPPCVDFVSSFRHSQLSIIIQENNLLFLLFFLIHCERIHS